MINGAERIVGNGGMAALIRSHDWCASGFEPIGAWPDTLVCAANIMLGCAFPSLIFWGPRMIQLYNDAFVPLIGEKHPVALGQTAQECWAEAWDIICPRLNSVLNTGQAVSHQAALVPILRDGRVQDVFWNYNYSAIFDADGAIAGILVLCQDVTAELVANRNLKESETRLRLALTAAHGVGLFDWDIEHDRVYADEAFARIYGVDPGRAAAGVSITEYLRNIHLDDRPHLQAAIERTLKGHSDFSSEYRLKQPDGSDRWVLVVAQGSYSPKGRPVRIAGLAVEVTHIKNTEQALRESEARLRSIYSTTLEYIGLLSPEGVLLETNRASLQFAGNTRSDVIGKNFWDCPWFTYTPGIPEQVREAVALGANGRAFRTQMLLNRPDGSPIPFDFSLTPVFDIAGNVVFLVPEGRDITELKRTEIALLESEKIAAVGRLASSIAHEINNPLEAVTNLIYLARSKVANTEVSDFLDAADQELRRVSNISSQTLRFHRQASDARAISAQELFATVLTIYEGRLRNQRVAVEVKHRSNDTVITFEGDIRQILSNLVGNALDAMGGGGRLMIRSHVGTDWKSGRRGIVLTVADTGKGMSQDVVDRIWEPFFTTKGISGTGLGLWISKEIAERHGCTLKVRSSRRPTHAGTVFQLFLPARKGARDGG